MNVQKMIDKLGFRLNDEAARKFNVSMRLDILNDSQITLVNLLHNNLLTELQEVETNLTTIVGANGIDAYYALTSLSNEVARNGVTNAKVYGASGKYFNIMDAEEVKKTENTYNAGTDEYPVGYIFKNRFYFQTSTAGGSLTLDLWYIKKPSALKYTYVTDSIAGGATDGTYGYVIQILESELTSAVNDYYNGSVLYNKTKDFSAIVYDYVGATKTLHVLYDVNEATEWEANDEWYFVTGPTSGEKLGDFESELNDSLHELVIDLAESTLYNMISNDARSGKALDKAMAQINGLNQRVVAEAAAGIGTTAREN